MNVKHLQKRKARRWMLLLLMLPLMAARAYAYDFSAVCSTGQTLYYNITDAVNHTVELTCPNHVEVDEEGYFISLYPWQNFQMPTGSITLPETVENNGVVYTVTSVGDFAFFYCEGLTGSLRIPNSVTAIGNYAFEYCSGFNSLTIGSSVTTIGDYAFHGCTGFRRTLSIPGTVTTIGNYAFYECSGFSGSLTIPNSVTSIGVYAFAYCTGFTGSLTIGNSVTTIGTDAFFRCTGFTGTLTIGSSVTTIGFAAFGRCTGFTGTLTIPNSVTTIDDYAFEYCSGLTGSLTIPNTVTTLGEYAFIGCTGFDGSLTLSNSLTAIRDYTFSECSNLTGLLTIPESVDSIGNSAFYKCSGFTGSLTIPESVTTIGNGAFYKCSGFTGSLTIPESVTTIGYSAFYDCSGFTGSLTIPESVTTIGYSAFYDCSGFTGSLTIPNSVTTIGSSAFAYCTGFTGSLTLPNSLTTISDDAFYSCSGFTGSLTIPESVTTIGSGAFASCRGFTGSLTIPNSVTTISDNAFYSCSGFTGSLTIGSSVTTIDYYAFAYCYYFTSIISKAATPPAAGSSCFSLSTSIPVSVPCGSTEAYRQAAQWSRFTNYSENLPFDVVVASSDEAMGSVAIIQEASCDDNQVIVQATPVLGYQFVNWTTDFYYFEGFEEGIPSDWATIDADGDGETWFASTEYEAHDILAIPSHGGSCHLMSESHCNVNGPLFPDNYLVMPRVSLPGGAVFSFWAAAQDVEFAQEHFGVAVSMGSQTNPNDFTLVGGAEWTISPGRSHSGNVRGGNRESTAWIKYTVDLSAYAGQDCYIAIRHFGCTEQQALCIDDVELISDEPMPVSDMATYSFLLTEDVMLTANFAPVEGYDIRVYANPVAGGTVTGAGIYGEMETVTVSATPNEDYRFVNWTESMIDSTSTFFESFENGLPSGWSTINADGDGHNWYHSTEAGSHNVTPGSAHSSSGFMLSESYCRANNQALNPDEYLVLPIMSIGDSCAFSFWACAYSSSWADEHFGVAISTNGNTNANDFTTINEWTLTAKSERGDNPRAQGNWYQYTVDLSAYSGQNIYVAIRHFNCSDQYILYVDDVELSSVITTTNEVLSTDPVYTFEATSNRQLVANFEYIGVVHVTPDGTGDGSSWDNALSNIQEAINLAAASNPKPRVWVKAGTYSGNSGDSDMHQITAYADATSTVGYLPMYGNYAYAYTRSQYVIPASEITSMTENFINSLTYYTTYNPSQWTSDFNVYLKEVDYTTMNDNGLIDPATATTVYTGRLSVADGQMVVTFDTPYYYRGGNLLIGMDCLSNDGNSSSCYFQAAYVTGAGGYAYDYDSPEFDYWNQVNYAPTTTFGYYNPDRLFTMAEGINVYGCFAGDEPHDYDLSLRDFVTNQTVLDGQHEHRVLYQLYDFTMQTVWDGFTIVNGYSDDEGGGAYLMANTKLQNCVFEHCQGIDGGAVYANGTEFVNCAFRKNAASDDGGALYVDGNGGQFVNCLFANNQADRGGAVYGISAYGCFAEFVNCNIVNNKSTYWGSGIYNLTPCGILHNCIVWGNESDSEAGQVFGEGSFSYCAVEGGISGENNIVLNSQNTGNGCTYPRFENPSLTAGADDETENVSWRLMENSACINHGNNEAIAGYATDLDGEDRIQLDVVDMGCYESPYEGIVIPDDGIVYVALDGNGDGTSWENALNDIQEAMGIAAASDPKSMVWVKAGTYSNDSGNRGMGQITAYADGTATVGTLPMYGLFADAYTRSQYVIPATEIAQMTGYSIYSLTYHTTSTPAQWQASFQVYLKEVNYTTMNSLIAPTTATTVYTGKLTVANGKMTIVFDTPYYYNGGNLLIGMDCLEKGNYANCKFQAAAVNGAGMYAYNYDASTFGTPHAVNYAPTTTFNFGEDLFLMVEGVNVYGGFAGNEPADYDLSLRDFEANQTVLDGQNEHSVLYQLDDFTTQTVWDGFTIANGHSDGNGAGAYLMANTKLQNCVFENCQGNDGGAVYANGAELVNCVFKKNTASNVGAVYVKNGVIVSSLFANNQADNGGGVYADGASEFINCDIVNNKAVNSGAGIYSNGGTFTNCIVWGNESDNEAGQVFGEGIFSYCAVEGRISGENNIVLNAQNIGNGCTYPRFENPSVTAGADDETENVSWRLMENSACINHGNNEAIAGYDLDIDGEDRIQLDVVDLGCYESPYEGIVIPDDGIVYVTPDGNGDGTSWENALNDIQEAMEMAAGADPKSMVWVAAGTYAGNGSIGGHLTAYANGSTTVNRLPMYALFADSYTRSQYVIPAAEIAQLTGYPIKSLTYYTTSTPAQLTSSFQVYLTEVDYSTMSSLIDPTTATTVYTGQLTVANGKMTVVFDAPYYYNGGNLLIGMDCIEKGNFANCYFQAEAVDGAGMYAFSSSSPTFSTPTVVNSIPTTTFSYGDGEDLFMMMEDVNVYGGFAGNEPADYDLSSRDFETNQTVLDGQHTRRVLRQAADFTIQTLWDGFTIANGYNVGNGGGAYLMTNSTLQNCVFENNQGSYGGAVYGGYDSRVTLVNCTFRNNTASTSGGAVFAYGGSLSGCLFTSNQAKYGGAVYANSSSVETEIENCDFRKNVASTSGGAIYTHAGRYANCLFENNRANYGGGLYVDNRYGSSEFINCDIVNNSGTYGGGIYNNSNGSTFTNCIVWGNANSQVSGNSSFSYCAVEGGISGENNICLTSQNAGNGYLSPRFENPSLTAGVDDETENVSWRLMEGSACINKGNNEAVADYEMDFAGESRIQQDVVDMGCYESPYEGTDIPEFTDGIVYVTPEGSGDGTSWSNATNDIQKALQMASLTDPRPMVWVAAGTYQGEGYNGILYTMMEGVNVYGGFVGNEPADYDLSSRDIETNLTVLDGQHELTVLRQANDFAMQTVWDGFTIANGNNSYNDNVGGGAFLLANSKLQNCVFEHCQSINWGGAVLADGAEFENCIFRNNEATYCGGAMDVVDGRFVNCLFANNQASYGGGICVEGEAEFINCDIVNNKSDDYGSGVYSYSDNGTFTNCIIWGNQSDEGLPQVNDKGNYSHCAVEGGMEGEGNIKLSPRNTGDFFCPQFENPSSTAGIDNAADNASWRLSETSICVNRGDNEAIDGYAMDLDGENRVYNDAVVDLGCYESAYEISNLVYPDGIAYVTPEGDGDGTSWDNAMNDIQDVMDALTFAESDPVIWVAAGTYLGNDGSELQMEMTAYPNGTATVGTLPMYGGYADYYTRSQYVIPAAEIAQLAGYPIYSLTYYTTSNPSQWTSDFQVYLTEVSNSTMSSLIDPTTATTVYTGKLSVANGEMTVIFDTPYHYNGGNLLIGMDCLSSNGNYSVCSFKAVSKSNAGMYAYNNTEATFSYSYAVNYVPTTTFNGEIVLYTMKEGLDVYGGFEGNEPADYDLSLRDFEANQTVLDGQLEHRVLYQPSDFTTQTIWDGFTLANGRAEDGNGGGALLKANSKLQNCVFENCQAYNGGAVYADGSEFENCIFRNDTATNDGGAVYLDYGDGGRFVNCLFAYNQAKRGGAICYYNQSYTESSPEFINCDIVNNSVTSDGYGGGIYNQTYGSNAIYTNCIVWGNKRNSYSNQIDGSGVAFSYCAVQGGWSGTGNINLAAANDGTSTSYKYVRFVNPENGDFRLKETSACVNMGKPDFTPSCLVDLEGNPRIYGDRIDIGCYEFSLSDGFHFLGMTNANWNLAANWLNSSMPSADDEAFIDANCVVNEDVDILKLTVSNGKSLSVPAGSTLTAGTLVTTAPAQLIIEDGGQLLNENNDVKGTVKKNINGYGTSEDGWYMIASPVTDNTNVTNLTFNTYNLFTFDGSEVLEWRTQHDNPAISHKTGYLYGNQEGTTLEFKGTLAGTTDATVLTLADGGEGMEFPGFNMIGNPYPCNAYITDSYLRTNALGNGFLPGTGAIAPCESVFVDAANDGQTVTFSKTPTRISFVSLTVAKNRGIADDRVIVRFDDSRNLEKFMFNESNTKLFIPQNDKEFAVVSAAENSKQDEVTEIPVSFKASEKGTYTISFDMEDVSAEYIHLIDNLTGADVDLLAAYANLKNSASYTFEAKPSDYASRFKLVFKVSNDDSTDSTSWFAYLSNGNLVIENIEGQATMQIIDVLGRVLNTEIVSGSYNKAHGLRAGLYIISLNGKTQKIVVE